MAVDWQKFVEMVRSHDRFLLTSHIRPDCDALGSELGMAAILEAIGKEVVIVNAHGTPLNLAFIDPQLKIKTLGVDAQVDELLSFDVLMILDTSAWAQLGEMGEVVKQCKSRKVILDHHVSEDDLGAESFKDTVAEATGRLVLDAAEQLGVKLTPAMTTPIFAAIATDTGWFRFGSTTGDTYRAAGKLIDAGASPSAIYNALYEQTTLARMQLIGRTMSRTRTDLSGRLAYTAILTPDFAATGALLSDTEDVVNMTLAIAGTQVAYILVEQPKGGFKISFRSRCNVDVSKLAGVFGGGGHKAAAGAFLEGSHEEVQAKVLDVVSSAMR